MPNKSNAKYVFLYILVLVTLGFIAINVGVIIFQIINAIFVETTFNYKSGYSQDDLRFAIAALIINAPIYYYVTRQINKELASGNLHNDSGIRKWLTYLILLVSSLVAIFFLMDFLESFLDGELTVKFVLKTITAIAISAMTFGYYVYDLRRSIAKDDKRIKIFSYAYIAVVIVSLVAAFFFIDSPTTAREKREDTERVADLQQISRQIDNFYRQNEALPASLENIKNLAFEDVLVDPVTNERYKYRSVDNLMYELCATFTHSNKDQTQRRIIYEESNWQHDTGETCFVKKIIKAPVR